MSTEAPRKQPIDPLLLVDDDDGAVKLMTMTLRVAGFSNIVSFTSSTAAVQWIQHNRFGVAVLDVVMPQLSGVDVLSEIREMHPDIPVIMATGVNDLETAISCMKHGAYDYIVKPVDSTRLVTSIGNAVKLQELQCNYERLSQTITAETCAHPKTFETIKTANPHMHNLFRYCEAVARTRYPVLITGETGTGKELFARAIHDASGVEGAFIAVNTAGLDDQMFSDTLFGHCKGAYTGADTNRNGLVEEAASGTLFLDEIGDLAPQSQVKLLRLLQEEEYLPLGTDTKRKSSCRIVAATNQSLAQRITTGAFRADLFYRLNTHHIDLPPLRKRREDIPLLLDWFITLCVNELGEKKPSYPSELIDLLSVYEFPGNVRELEGMVRDALMMHRKGVLSTRSFKKAMGVSAPDIAMSAGEEPSIIFPEKLPSLRQVEQALVEEAYRRSNENQSIAASLIGITRQAFAYRLKKEVSR